MAEETKRRPGRPPGTGAPRVLTRYLHVRLTPEILGRLEGAAERAGATPSEIVRRALGGWLDRLAAQKSDTTCDTDAPVRS